MGPCTSDTLGHILGASVHITPLAAPVLCFCLNTINSVIFLLSAFLNADQWRASLSQTGRTVAILSLLILQDSGHSGLGVGVGAAFTLGAPAVSTQVTGCFHNRDTHPWQRVAGKQNCETDRQGGFEDNDGGEAA